MSRSATPDRWTASRFVILVSGVGMMFFSTLTMRHYFEANYPVSIFEGSFCDLNAFFNCDSSAYSVISAVGGVPIGWFGLALGALIALGALFPSARLVATNRTLSLLNVIGVVVSWCSGSSGPPAGSRVVVRDSGCALPSSIWECSVP
jgi:uncharacterized membrane protein